MDSSYKINKSQGSNIQHSEWLYYFIHNSLKLLHYYWLHYVLYTLLFWVRVYTSFLCFLSREHSLVFVEELFWWCWMLWALACLESFWFFPYIWMSSLLGTVICIVSFPFFITLGMSCHSLVAWRVSIER